MLRWQTVDFIRAKNKENKQELTSRVEKQQQQRQKSKKNNNKCVEHKCHIACVKLEKFMRKQKHRKQECQLNGT